MISPTQPAEISEGVLATSDNPFYENLESGMHPRRALTGLPWLALVASDQHRYWKRNKEHIAFDPSAFAKSGRESVGVARQWCGRLGKVDNWQVAPPQAAGKDLPGVAWHGALPSALWQNSV